MFSPYYFHVIISIGILKSNSLSLSTPSRTKWTLVYLLMLYSTSAEGLETFLQVPSGIAFTEQRIVLPGLYKLLQTLTAYGFIHPA